MESLTQNLIRTRHNDWAPLALRLVLGFVMSAHGSQKLFGWFGGSLPPATEPIPFVIY
jgi:putative oxidoreductase